MPKKTKPKRGGSRPGAGRPAADTIQFLVRPKPETADAIRRRAEALQITPGQLLDRIEWDAA